MKTLLFLMFLILIPTVLFAQPSLPTPVPETADQVSVGIEYGSRIIDALQSKNYQLAVGLALMITVFFINKYLSDDVPKDYMATFVLGIATFGGFGAALVAGIPPFNAALTFLLCGTTAIGFWEGFFKHLWSLYKKGKE